MKKELIIPMLFVLATLVLHSCNKQISTTAFHSYETECLGKTMDGRQTLRVWAQGRNRADAIQQAMKKAVYDVTFMGISAGSGECNAYPVVDEANARKKYEDYFDIFFTDGGAYTKYVTTENQKRTATNSFKGHGSQTFDIIVVVDRSALRRRFESDNIILNGK